MFPLLYGVEPRFVEFDGDDPHGFVVSANFHHRIGTNCLQAVRDGKNGVCDRKVVRDCKKRCKHAVLGHRFVRGSAIKLVTDNRTISPNYITVTVGHGLVRDFIKPEICGCY